MLPFLRLGPLLLQTPGIALLAGIWVGTAAVEREADRLRLRSSAILTMITVGLLGGLLGARILFALEHLEAYLSAPLSLFAVSATALDAAGGLLVGAATAWLWGRRAGLSLRPTLDALAPGLALFTIALGVANLLSGHGYGSPLRAPWAIYLWGEYRHPTQIYELILAVLVFLLWRYIGRSSGSSGMAFLGVVELSAAARLLTEALHADSQLLPGGFRLPQVIALVILAVAFYLATRWSGDHGAGGEQLAPGRAPQVPN